MELITSLLILTSSFLAAFAILRERNKLLLFRMTALIFSIAVVGMFNLNWLLGIAIKNLSWVVLFGVLLALALILRKENIFLEIRNIFTENKRAYIFSLVVFAVGFVLASSYFHWDLNVPRYSTPDSGVHFLYMNDTAQKGVMSLFGTDLITEASGDASILPRHNEAYMPGATAVFALLENLFKSKNPAMMLQIFNIVCYATLAGYFIFLLYYRQLIKKKITIVLLAVIILLGTFFNFVATSHSTQLLGLLFLVAFVDFFEDYLTKKESMLPAALALGAMVTTYFYWLPVALAFVGIRFLFYGLQWKNLWKQVLKTALPLLLGFVFCLGYIVVMFKLNMFQYSSADGGVAFQDYLLADALWIAPFAVLQFVAIFLGWRSNTESKKFAAAFFGGIAFFALTLAVLYKNALFVSHYTAMKVLYLVVPAAWALALMFFEENLEEIKMFFGKIIQGHWKALYIFKKQIFIIVLLFLATTGVAKAFDVDWKFLALAKKNAQMVVNNETEAALSREQMGLLDDLRLKYSDLLEDGQILVVAPTKNALWSFAYSGIWPRTKSLIPENGSRAGIYSELSFYSGGIADYGLWLKQDKKHALVYFDTDESIDWMGRSMFDIANYELLEKKEGNILLKLKDDANVVYAFKWEDSQVETEKVKLPVKIDFVSVDDVLNGTSLRFQVGVKKDVQSEVLLELFSEKCSENMGKKELEARISKDELTKKGDKRTVKVIFDKVVSNAKNKNFCIKLSAPDEKTAQAVRIAKFKDGSYEINPVYSFVANFKN